MQCRTETGYNLQCQELKRYFLNMFQNEINQSLAVSDGIKQTLPVTALHPSQITHEALFGIICMGLQYQKKS